MTKSIDGAIVDWLEEIPIEELNSETAKIIIEQFRNGSLPVTEATCLLEHDCNYDMAEWINENKRLNSQLKGK